MGRNVLSQYRSPALYGALLAAMLFLLNWLKLKFVVVERAFEVYIGMIALIFTALGIWLALKLTHSKIQNPTINGEGSPIAPFTFNQSAAEELSLSKRELDVLQLMARGLSNQEIADNLFVSLSTVKTHTTNLFDKMAVRRRTQAIQKGRRLGIIP